jgi:hypothetical protein
MHYLVNATGHWYTSGAVIGWAGVVIALVVGISAVAMWRLGLPRRAITYSAEVTPLLATVGLAGIAASSLQVLLDGREVASPHLLKLRVESRSRRDIASSDFDAHEPLSFGLDADLRSVVMERADEIPKGVLLGSPELMFGPVLIRRGELFRLNLLTDGRPTVTCEANPLLNVDVRAESSGEAADILARLLWLVFFGFAFSISLGLDAAKFVPAAGAIALSVATTIGLVMWIAAVVSPQFLARVMRWRPRRGAPHRPTPGRR